MSEPAGYEAIKVHVESVADGVQLGQAPAPEKRHRRVVTRFLTETVDATNPVRPLLPDDPDRICAYVQVSGGDVILCGSKQDASQPTPAGSDLPSTNTAPWPVRGTNAVWAAQKTSATTCVISVTADYAVPT